MTHESSHIIIQRVANAVKSSVTGDTKYVSLVLAAAAVVGWLF